MSIRKISEKFNAYIRKSLEDLSNRFPLFGEALLSGWSFLFNIKFVIEKKILKFRNRLKFGTHKAFFKAIHWINPELLLYCVKNDFDKKKYYCRILDGDWDLSEIKFDNLDVHKAFIQRFKEGKQWKETKFYNRILNQVNEGIRKWGCKNKNEIDDRFSELDKLFYQIKSIGFKTQNELQSSKTYLPKFKNKGILDEITIAIGRDGKFLFVDGRHRLSIARILNTSKIPVVFMTRHKKWMDYRYTLSNLLTQDPTFRPSKTVDHLDLQDLWE